MEEWANDLKILEDGLLPENSPPANFGDLITKVLLKARAELFNFQKDANIREDIYSSLRMFFVGNFCSFFSHILISHFSFLIFFLFTQNNWTNKL